MRNSRIWSARRIFGWLGASQSNTHHKKDRPTSDKTSKEFYGSWIFKYDCNKISEANSHTFFNFWTQFYKFWWKFLWRGSYSKIWHWNFYKGLKLNKFILHWNHFRRKYSSFPSSTVNISAILFWSIFDCFGKISFLESILSYWKYLFSINETIFLIGNPVETQFRVVRMLTISFSMWRLKLFDIRTNIFNLRALDRGDYFWGTDFWSQN